MRFWKLLPKVLIEKLPRSRRYRLLRQMATGSASCFSNCSIRSTRLSPLACSIRIAANRTIAKDRLQHLDRLYQSVTATLGQLVVAVGLKVAA